MAMIKPPGYAHGRRSLRVEPVRQGAEGPAPVAVEPRRAEGVGHGRRRVAHEQAGLEREGHHLDHAAGDRLELAQVGQTTRELVGEGVEPRVGASGLAHLVEEGVDARRARAASRADTSRQMTLPVPSQMPFSGASR